MGLKEVMMVNKVIDNFKQIRNNRTRLISPRKIEYIVIHDTGNRRIGANAEMHFQYFNNSYRGSSADIFIDDKQALQINDYSKYRSWHCGDGKGKYGITNQNSIGVELCINADGNYDIAVNKTINVIVGLMQELNVSIDKVRRHFDASRKNCPQTMNNDGNWSTWIKFKNIVNKKLKDKLKEKEVDDLADNKIEQWKVNLLKELHDEGIVTDFNYWVTRLDDTPPVWLTMALTNNAYKKLKKGE